MFSMSKNYIVFDSMMVPPQKNIFLLLYCIIFDNKFLLILRNSKLLSINFLCVTLSHMSIISWDVTEADEHLHDRWLQGFCIQVPDKEIRKQLEQIIKQQYQEKGMEDPTETDIV